MTEAETQTKERAKESLSAPGPLPDIGRRRAFFWLALVLVEVLSAVIYFSLSPSTAVTVRHVVYPFVWINLSIWAVSKVYVPDASVSKRLVAGGISVFYLTLLTYFGGVLGFADPSIAYDFGVTWASPGWGPILYGSLGGFYFKLVPFFVVGYATLSYLVYTGILEATKSALAGAVGLVSCVGCTWPVISAALSVLVGSTTFLGSTVYAWSYGLSTVVFAVSVLVLVRYR
ncbi:MAG: hypothetical protein SV760_09320 [Halobacteria archaeon]|nr:hypothetical protein [Halobacteria archaeon]